MAILREEVLFVGIRQQNKMGKCKKPLQARPKRQNEGWPCYNWRPVSLSALSLFISLSLSLSLKAHMTRTLTFLFHFLLVTCVQQAVWEFKIVKMSVNVLLFFSLTLFNFFCFFFAFVFFFFSRRTYFRWILMS